MILTVKCWIKNTDVTNNSFFILKISDVACQMPTQFLIKKKKKKIPTQI